MDYLVKDTKKRYTLGTVYMPNEVDLQGDWASESTIEKACWDYMRALQTGASGLNDMHVNSPWDNELGDVVECFCAPADITIENKTIKKGTWLLGVVWSPETFQKIENGKRIGYSMEGKGARV